MKANRNPNQQINDPHARTRNAEWDAKIATNKLIELLGSEKAELIAQSCILNSLNEQNQLDREMLAQLLKLALSQAELNALKARNFRRWVTIKNIAAFSKRGAINDKQVISELIAKTGYTKLEQVQAEFPHLWEMENK